MEQQYKKCFNPTLISASLFVVMSLTLGLILSNSLVIFLSWNMVLAITAYLLSVLVAHLNKKKVHVIGIVLSLFFWLSFFPNSFYILTDFIHFQNYDFFNTYPNIYALDINSWYVFFDIVIGALIGLKLGVLSISNVLTILPKQIKKYEPIFLLILFILSSIGIYLGRFIRLNSWNILSFSTIFKAIFEHLGFFGVFILLFIIIQGLAYILFKEKGD